jgi:hypothetical protein
VGRIAADLKVRHITPDRLPELEPLLVEIRRVEGLVERKPGTFYRRSRAFLHFHEDGDEIYADVRLTGEDFERVRATTAGERRALVARIRTSLRAG